MMTKSASPSRASTKSRRLERTESPTSSAPPSTPTAVETPSSTARFVRQYHVRLRASRVEVRMTQLVPDGEPGGQLRVVRYHHQDGLLPLVQLEQQRSHHIGRRLIEVARRLVAEQQKRLPDQGTRQRYALLLAARKLGGAMGLPVGQPPPLGQLAPPPRAAGMSVIDQRPAQPVLQHRATQEKPKARGE